MTKVDFKPVFLRPQLTENGFKRVLLRSQLTEVSFKRVLNAHCPYGHTKQRVFGSYHICNFYAKLILIGLRSRKTGLNLRKLGLVIDELFV